MAAILNPEDAMSSATEDTIQDTATTDEIDFLRCRAERLLSERCAGGFSGDVDAMVITEAFAPYSIVHVNQAWCELCKFTSSDAVGNSCVMVQGPRTDMRTLRRLMKRVTAAEPCTGAYLYNYKGDGSLFMNEVQIVSGAVADHPPTFFAAKL